MGCERIQTSNGWTPVLGIEVVDDETVLKVTDWIGGKGTKPKKNIYVSANGFTEDINQATRLVALVEGGPQGPQGAVGPQGSQGANGIGTQGPQGVQGAQGASGVQGSAGAPGSTGQDGEAGRPGSKPEFRYAINTSTSVPPALNAATRNPVGWTMGAPGPQPLGNYIWETFALIDGDDNLDVNWITPRRVSPTPGAPGTPGTPGSDGPQGPQGPQGEEGIPLYTWLKYADSPTTGMSDSPVGKQYMGIAYNKTSPAESSDYADYTWALIVGEGMPGPQGPDGESLYTWVRYADDETGAGISNSPDGKTYIGLAYNKNTPTESNNPADYTWAKIEGPQGSQGLQGSQGTEGSQGPQGSQGSQGSQGNQGVQGPVGQPGTPGGPGPQGPAAVLRGDFDPDRLYQGLPTRVDMVRYLGNGYITKVDAGDIPIGTLPTDTDYWNGPFPNVDAIFADFGAFTAAYVSDLLVYQLATNPAPDVVPDPTLQGERYTVGFMPDNPDDPTSNAVHFSRHAPRQYHPSGRIASYTGQVNNFIHQREVDGVPEERIVDGWAIITFEDKVGSPVHFVLDIQTSQGIIYSKVGADTYTPSSAIVVRSGTGDLTQANVNNILNNTTKVAYIYAKFNGPPQFGDWEPRLNSVVLYKAPTTLYNFTPAPGSTLHAGLTTDTSGTYFNGYLFKKIVEPVAANWETLTVKVDFLCIMELDKYVDGVVVDTVTVSGRFEYDGSDINYQFNPAGPPTWDGQIGRTFIDVFSVEPEGLGNEEFTFDAVTNNPPHPNFPPFSTLRPFYFVANPNVAD